MKRNTILKKATATNFIDTINRFLAFKSNAPFTNCISNDNAEDLDVVMPMYNLLEYRKSYRKTTGIFWNYYKDEPNNLPLNDDDPPIVNYDGDAITNSESFKYKSSITGKTLNTNQGTEQGNTTTKKTHY